LKIVASIKAFALHRAGTNNPVNAAFLFRAVQGVDNVADESFAIHSCSDDLDKVANVDTLRRQRQPHAGSQAKANVTVSKVIERSIESITTVDAFARDQRRDDRPIVGMYP